MKFINFYIDCSAVLGRLMCNVMKIIWKKRYKQKKLRQERNGHKILQVMLLVLEVSSPDMQFVLPFIYCLGKAQLTV